MNQVIEILNQGRDSLMRLWGRYKRLTLWNKLGVVGSIASIVGVGLFILTRVGSSLPTKDSTAAIIIASNHQRDLLIADQYYTAMNYFVVKFRFIVAGLSSIRPVPAKIDSVFHPGVDILKTKVNFNGMNAEVIKLIFLSYDFSLPSTVESEPQTISAQWFTGELEVLRRECGDILAKYASTGNPELIRYIESMVNRIENVFSPFGPKNYANLNNNQLRYITDVFDHLIRSFELIGEIRATQQPNMKK